MQPFCMASEWSTSTITPFSGEYKLLFISFVFRMTRSVKGSVIAQIEITQLLRTLYVFICLCNHQRKKMLASRAVLCCFHGNVMERGLSSGLSRLKEPASANLKLQASANTAIVLFGRRQIVFERQYFEGISQVSCHVCYNWCQLPQKSTRVKPIMANFWCFLSARLAQRERSLRGTSSDMRQGSPSVFSSALRTCSVATECAASPVSLW